jgi:hypothetical protein
VIHRRLEPDGRGAGGFDGDLERDLLRRPHQQHAPRPHPHRHLLGGARPGLHALGTEADTDPLIGVDRGEPGLDGNVAAVGDEQPVPAGQRAARLARPEHGDHLGEGSDDQRALLDHRRGLACCCCHHPHTEGHRSRRDLMAARRPEAHPDRFLVPGEQPHRGWLHRRPGRGGAEHGRGELVHDGADVVDDHPAGGLTARLCRKLGGFDLDELIGHCLSKNSTSASATVVAACGQTERI